MCKCICVDVLALVSSDGRELYPVVQAQACLSSSSVHAQLALAYMSGSNTYGGTGSFGLVSVCTSLTWVRVRASGTTRRPGPSSQRIR